MKAYNFFKGACVMFEKKEEKRIVKANFYFYLNFWGDPVLFDIQRALTEKIPYPSLPPVMYQPFDT